MKRLLFIASLTLTSVIMAEEPDTRSSVELANRALVEVRRVGEAPGNCQLSIEQTNKVPRFVTGLAPCGALSGAEWQGVVHTLGLSYSPEQVHRRNIELSQEHSINPNRYRSMGELKLEESHIIQLQENGGSHVFVPFEKVECEPIPSAETDNSRLFRHPESGEVTRMEEGIIRYFLPGRDEPIEKQWNFSTFNDKCNELLTEQLSQESGENYSVGLCLAYHQTSPSNFPIAGERPQYYCLSNVFLDGEKACVGEAQEEPSPSEAEAKDDEPTEIKVEEELEGNGGSVCCGGWSEGRSCSLCTTNDAENFGYRDVFDSRSEGTDPTFHVVECIGPNEGNSYNWGATLRAKFCNENDPCCNESNYNDGTLVQECLQRLNWKAGDCAQSASGNE